MGHLLADRIFLRSGTSPTRPRWGIVPGTVGLFGIVLVVSCNGLSWQGMLDNFASNPTSYIMACSGALMFELYCKVTRRYAGGGNGVTLFMMLTAALIWAKYFFSSENIPALTLPGRPELLLTGIACGGGYALWNIGILRGNLTLLSTVSYFAPVLSSAFAAVWLGVELSGRFWQGTVLVTVGSLRCWMATRQRVAKSSEPTSEQLVE